MSAQTITKDMTVAQAVKVNPDLMDVLAKDGIDFCCGGGNPLAEALQKKGLDVGQYVAKLNMVQPRKEASRAEVLAMNGPQLVDYIIHHYHVQQLQALDEIELNLQKLINVHFEHHFDSLQPIYQTFLQLKGALVPHFREEEHVEFPEFLAGKPVNWDALRAEHEFAGEVLEHLDALTNHYTVPADGCATYQYTFTLMKELEAGLHEHIFLENSILFEMKQ